jgi:glycosyltransferase involved in cell wall biosynthesis
MIRAALNDYPAEKIFRVSPGIHHSWFDMVRQEDQKNKYVITFFGRVEYEKGLDVLISAFQEVNESYPQSILNVIGEGNWEEKAQQLAGSLGLEKKVIFHGWKELPDLQKVVGKSALCVLPSRVESFGLTIAEAMASGVAVVSTRVAAIPELIADRENGLLVPANDQEHLRDAILYAFNNKEKMSEMAQKARQRIQAHFTWERTAEEYLTIYDKLR